MERYDEWTDETGNSTDAAPELSTKNALGFNNIYGAFGIDSFFINR